MTDLSTNSDLLVLPSQNTIDISTSTYIDCGLLSFHTSKGNFTGEEVYEAIHRQDKPVHSQLYPEIVVAILFVIVQVALRKIWK